VLTAEPKGQPAIDLPMLPAPQADDMIRIEGLSLPRRQPTIVFGDGGSAKSYLALWLAGRMAEKGIGVALFDWEFEADAHRDCTDLYFGYARFRLSCSRILRSPSLHISATSFFQDAMKSL
jgi:hypothetical protein